MRGRALAYVALGFSGLFIIASLTVLGEVYPRNVIALGIGVVLLSSSLVFLQLSYWREGKARNGGEVEGAIQAAVRRAPPELKNPHMRRIWQNMEESRRLVALKEEEDRKAEWRKEEERLGLSFEEEIVFMDEPSWLAFSPLAVVSAMALLISAFATNPMISFLCLAVGLSSLFLLTLLKGRTRYYLTNFRVLVRERFPGSGRVRWSSLRYLEVQRCSLERELGRRRLKLEGNKKRIAFRGLTGASLLTAARVLRNYLPVANLS